MSDTPDYALLETLGIDPNPNTFCNVGREVAEYHQIAGRLAMRGVCCYPAYTHNQRLTIGLGDNPCPCGIEYCSVPISRSAVGVHP